MCLVTKLEQPIIAEKPITCYKVLWYKEDKFVSFFHSNFEWEMDKVHTTTLRKGEKLEDGRGTVYQGFHSYKDLYTALMFMSWTTLTCAAAECIIPKGAKYYVGEEGDYEGYASEQLMPIKVMTLEELTTKFYDKYPFRQGYTMMIESKYLPSSLETFKITNIHLCKNHVKLQLETNTLTDKTFSRLYYMDTDYEGNPLSKDESIIAYGKDSLMNPEIEE